MEKIWKDGRVKIELNDSEINTLKHITAKDIPSNKEIITMLKLIIDILTC